MILSILIATLNSRSAKLDNVVKQINEQMAECGQEIELIICPDDGETTTGEKRQQLLNESTGEYIVFVDDDDDLASDYLKEILEALKDKPDAVGFNIIQITNNGNRICICSNRFDLWMRLGDCDVRTITHIQPVKREIAIKIGFQELYYKEDYHYAMGIKPFITVEKYIDNVLYFHNKLTTNGPPTVISYADDEDTNGIMIGGMRYDREEYELQQIRNKDMCYDDIRHNKLINELKKQKISIIEYNYDGLICRRDDCDNLFVIDGMKQNLKTYYRGYMDLNLIVRRFVETMAEMKGN